MDNSRSSAKFGVRGRLLLAFLGISAFSLIAAASGFYSLSQVGGALTRITEERVPQSLAWLELSRRVEGIVRSAPALLVVDTEEERVKVSNEIAAQTSQLTPLVERSQNFALVDTSKATEQVARLVTEMNENLVAMDELVKRRLSIATQKGKLIRQLSNANSVAKRALAAGARILGTQTAKWERSDTAAKFGELSPELQKLARSIIELTLQQEVAVLVDTIQGIMLKIATSTTAQNIDLLIFPLKKSLTELSDLSQGLPKRVQRRLIEQIGLFEKLAVGPISIGQARKDELRLIGEAQNLLKTNVQMSSFLTTRINFLVNGANRDILDARSQASDVQALSKNVLVGVVILSLLSSILIVWLYVGRNLIARLTALSNSMLAIAEGNLRTPLPEASGNDEITHMVRALTGFRDTAIEVEAANLRDIESAQRRLVDAIENSSEGFAFYDQDDNLVICNSRYQDLLYPGADLLIEPGMRFEQIIRSAAEAGNIVDAEDRIDEWVEERLHLHRNPGEPRVQQRGDGRWILITERKTGDGGTVAIYSDITELKQREEDLTKKSNALEQLSTQLAKYLSPQIYDSIFSGKQEVKLASQRKRLTVFFSDLVGFTAITEKLESEDLTRLLNQYLTEMSNIALEYGATIDKYIGDAIVIFFGDPETLGIKEDAVACVSMAIAMRKRMVDFNKLWSESGLEEPLQCRIGINTGICTVGNFGSDDRMDYTIIGGGVNLAARLETAGTPNEILISYETYAHVKGLIHCEPQEKLTVKGFAKPVATYKVIDFHENMDESTRPVRATFRHFQLDADMNLMSLDERQEALTVLSDLVERLTDSGAKL